MVSVFTLLLVYVITSRTHAELAVQIERHFPCSSNQGPNEAHLKIKFPSYKAQGVHFLQEHDQRGRTCFMMAGGQVEVFPPGLEGTKKYYVHLEVRFGIHGKPERCVNPEPDGCGGFGSCVYCDICSMSAGYKDFVTIYQGGAPARCDMAAGSYNDIALRVCLPSEKELLPLLDKNAERSQQIMDIFVSTRARAGKIPVVIAARLFDRPINNIPMSQLNDMLYTSKEGMVGCHYIYATATRVQ